MKLETLDGVKFKYTKPHGSVNWYRLVYRPDPDTDWHNLRLGGAPLENFERKLSKEVFTGQAAHNLLNKDKIKRFHRNFENSFYPAISVPLGEYEYTSQEHIDAIIPDLKNTKSVLCIGFSALDLDILNLIKNYIPKIKKLGIVNGGRREGQETFSRIKKICGNVAVEEKDAVFDAGFSLFLSRNVSKWLSGES